MYRWYIVDYAMGFVYIYALSLELANEEARELLGHKNYVLSLTE